MGVVARSFSFPEWIDERKLESDADYRRQTLLDITKSIREFIETAARIVVMMDGAGDEFPQGMPNVYLRALRRIGSGAMLPEVYMNMSFNSTLLSAVGMLPISDQHELIERKAVEVVVANDDGQLDVLNVKLTDLTRWQIAQVFDAGILRDPAKQRAWIGAQKTKALVSKKPSTAEKGWEISKKPKGAIVNGQFLSEKDIWAISRELEK